MPATAASASAAGLVTTGAQTFAGAKTFAAPIYQTYTTADGNVDAFIQTDSNLDISAVPTTQRFRSLVVLKDKNNRYASTVQSTLTTSGVASTYLTARRWLNDAYVTGELSVCVDSSGACYANAPRLNINTYTAIPAGRVQPVLRAIGKTSDASATYDTHVISLVGTENTLNTGTQFCSKNGPVFVSAGESSGYLYNFIPNFDTEHVFITADGAVNMFVGLDNTGSTYTAAYTFGGGHLYIDSPAYNVGATRTADIWSYMQWRGLNSVAVAYTGAGLLSNGNSELCLCVYEDSTVSTRGSALLRLVYDKTNKTSYVLLPTTPAITDSSTKAATTAYVQNQQYVSPTREATTATRTDVKGTPVNGTWYSLGSYDSSGTKNAAHQYGYIALRTYTGGSVRWDISVRPNIANDTSAIGLHINTTGANTGSVYPSTTNIITLGTSANKWQEIWCTQSSINSSSDIRLKSEIADIPDSILDAWSNVKYRQYHFKDAVLEKGVDKARLHTGLIAQEVSSIFKSVSVDASKYGWYLFDKWDATPADIDKDGNVVNPAKPAGDSYGIRYIEALCIEAAYQRRRADRLEARLAALEEKVAKL